MWLIIQVLARLPEFIQALSQAPRKSRYFFRSEKHEYNEQDDKKIWAGYISNSKRENIHYYLNLLGTINYSR